MLLEGLENVFDSMRSISSSRYAGCILPVAGQRAVVNVVSPTLMKVFAIEYHELPL